MSTEDWTPQFSPWRHGGWYVDNVRYPSGAVGCVSRNYPDHKWRLACDDRAGSYPGGPDDHTYPSRDTAARAERELAEERTAETIDQAAGLAGYHLETLRTIADPSTYDYQVRRAIARLSHALVEARQQR